MCSEASGFISGVKETWLKIIQKHATVLKTESDSPQDISQSTLHQEHLETFNLWIRDKRYVLDYWNS
jgi:hypothetical protein